MADDTLNRLAEHTGGIDVVEHRWGLYKGRPSRRARECDDWRLSSDFVPDGYHLVAEVANLAPFVKVEPDSEAWLTLCKWLNDFLHDPRVPGPKLSDIGANQVGFYEVVGDHTTLAAAILDIDPFFDPKSWAKS